MTYSAMRPVDAVQGPDHKRQRPLTWIRYCFSALFAFSPARPQIVTHSLIEEDNKGLFLFCNDIGALLPIETPSPPCCLPGRQMQLGDPSFCILHQKRVKLPKSHLPSQSCSFLHSRTLCAPIGQIRHHLSSPNCSSGLSRLTPPQGYTQQGSRPSLFRATNSRLTSSMLL